MRSHPRKIRRSSINTGCQSSFDTHNSQLQKFGCAQVWRVAAAAAATTTTSISGFSIGLSLGYGLDFFLGMLTLESDTLP
jgi:hypothetical protein